MKHWKYKIIPLFIALFFIAQCDKQEDPDDGTVNVPTGKGYELLSDYNFFEGDLHDLIPNSTAKIIPYDLNMPLFSDYALKKRFVYVPNGSVTAFDTTKVLDLPLGSVLIKHFYYDDVDGAEKYMETRLLILQADGWQAETYEWNEAQTDAKRTVLGGTRNITATVNGQSQNFNYLIPNVNQCKNCHSNNGAIEPVGPRVQNLNKTYDYVDGTENQLDRWIAAGILESPSFGNVPTWPKMDDATASLHQKARAYLDVNCASCHRLEGSASNSGLYLEYENEDSLSLGYFKTPTAAGGGSGGLQYVLKPGDADASILLYRMISDEVDERMPEIGRDLSHQQGVQLIRDWINSQ